MDRQAPSLRVQIGSEIVLRRAEPHVLERDLAGRATVVRLRPQLRSGEILCERAGEIPMIVTDASQLFPALTAQEIGYDAWYKARTDAAHAEFMRRTSVPPSSDWRTFPPEDIARYFGIPLEELG